jgi:dTDP-4-amino-4,6-dideoxygalactose transaminase
MLEVKSMEESDKIKLFNPLAEYKRYEEEIASSMLKVLESGCYILGEQVALFEEELARYLGVEHVVAVASGTDALTISLAACGVGPGDEVVTSPFTFIATASAILRLGAVPVFADISLDDFNLDPASVEGCLGERTRAILPVHLFGCPAPMREILEVAERHDLVVVEDAAQALGAEIMGRRVGNLGTAAAFSFYPTKVLGGYGDGGAVSTNHAEVAKVARMLRNHGAAERNLYLTLGYNSRLDELQAAALRVKLKHVEEMIEERRAIAAAYDRVIAGGPVEAPRQPQGARHVYSLYTVMCEERDSLKDFLGAAGVECGIYYPRPLYRNALFEKAPFRKGDCSRAETACGKVLSLPLYPALTESEVAYVREKLLDWIEEGPKKGRVPIVKSMETGGAS